MKFDILCNDEMKWTTVLSDEVFADVEITIILYLQIINSKYD